MNTQSDSQNELSKVLEKIQEIVEKSADGDYIYRGEPECYREAPYYGKVSSNLYRALLFDSLTTEDAEEYYAKTIEPHITKFETEILKAAKTYLYETDNETISDFEIFARLQHYGCKTNLIDFTTDYLIALFFACDRSGHKDGRVILLKKESKDYEVDKPSQSIKRAESQKSVLVRSKKGSVNPDRLVIIPKELKLSVLNYLDKYHDISIRNIYKDIHGFIKWLDGYLDPMLKYGKGVVYQNRANLEDNMQEKSEWHKKAYEHFTEALELKSDFTEAYINRGAVFRDVGKFDLAFKDFDTAIEIEPKSANMYYERGIYYAKKGEHEKALNDFKIAIDLDSENADFYNSRGIIYKDTDEADLAIKEYKKAIEVDAELPEAYNNLGVIYGEKGEHDKAIENYTKAIELRSVYANAYRNRGCAYLKKGNMYRANEDFFSVAILQSDFGKAFYHRGIACLHQKKWEEAKANLTFARDNGVDIIALFHNDYKSIEDFEEKNDTQLPKDIAAMLRQQ